MLEIKNFFLELLKSKKILFLLFIFSFTIFLGYFIKSYFDLLGYSGIFGSHIPIINNNINHNIIYLSLGYFIYLIILDSFNSGLSNKINKKIFAILNLLILISGLMFLLFTDGDNYRINLMKDRYADIIAYDPSYVKNKNNIDLLKAIENNNPKDFINILKNYDDNSEQNKNSLIKLFEIVNEFFPEKKVMLLSALKDDYFTKKEFKDIKLSILKDIDNKELNTAQIAMIGDLKW